MVFVNIINTKNNKKSIYDTFYIVSWFQKFFGETNS